MRQRVMHHGARRRRERRRRAVWTGGELLVTVGTVLLLLVVHQLWWTDREAKQGAQHGVEALEREWGRGGGDDSFMATGSRVPTLFSPTAFKVSPAFRTPQ